MSDSLERLHQAVMAARELDPALSRTARLFHRGQAKMAKKLAEEAIEVVIDAVNGNGPAVVRESADLLYNLMVVWVAAGVKPADIWAEMDRREKLFGIAEKLPKVSPKGLTRGLSKNPPKSLGPLAKAVAPGGRPALAAAPRRAAKLR